LIEEGVSGFVVENIDEAAEAISKLSSIDRRRCRAEFEKRFSARRMAQDYVAVYEALINDRSTVNAWLANGYHAS
jgi:glycosyltransferase involved in cell wall biosynthesis